MLEKGYETACFSSAVLQFSTALAQTVLFQAALSPREFRRATGQAVMKIV